MMIIVTTITVTTIIAVTVQKKASKTRPITLAHGPFKPAVLASGLHLHPVGPYCGKVHDKANLGAQLACYYMSGKGTTPQSVFLCFRNPLLPGLCLSAYKKIFDLVDNCIACQQVAGLKAENKGCGHTCFNCCNVSRIEHTNNGANLPCPRSVSEDLDLPTKANQAAFSIQYKQNGLSSL